MNNNYFFFPIGYGWFTINLINTYFYGEKNDLSSIHLPPGCKPYVKLFVNDKLVKESTTKKHNTLHDANISFETAKILKNSTILRLEIWDAGSGLWSGTKSIFWTSGNVESFLNEPIRKNNMNSSETIDAEIISFWRDELK